MVSWNKEGTTKRAYMAASWGNVAPKKSLSPSNFCWQVSDGMIILRFWNVVVLAKSARGTEFCSKNQKDIRIQKQQEIIGRFKFQVNTYPRLRNPGNSSGLREYPGYSSTSWEYTVYSRNTPGIPVFGGRTLFRSVFNYLRGNHHLRIPTEWRGTIPDRLGWWNPDESKVVLMIFDSFFSFFLGKNGKWKIATSKPCRSREIPHANPWKKKEYTVESIYLQ